MIVLEMFRRNFVGIQTGIKKKKQEFKECYAVNYNKPLTGFLEDFTKKNVNRYS